MSMSKEDDDEYQLNPPMETEEGEVFAYSGPDEYGLLHFCTEEITVDGVHGIISLYAGPMFSIRVEGRKGIYVPLPWEHGEVCDPCWLKYGWVVGSTDGCYCNPVPDND